MGVFTEMTKSQAEVLLDQVYREVLKMSPAVHTDYRGSPSKLGYQVQMADGKTVILNQQIAVRGHDVHDLTHQIVEAMRPSFGFMSNTSHFVAKVTEVWRRDSDFAFGALVIWGVA